MDERVNSTASWEELNIVRIDETRRYKRTDRLIKEEAYTLHINGQLVHSFACTPIDLEELAIGYAFAEGYFDDKGAIQGISVDREAQEIRLSLRSRDTAQITALPGGEVTLSKEAIYTLWETFNEQCNLFHITGGVHALALTDGKAILALHEDAARHNAVAKTIGAMVLRDLGPEGKAFICSGRLALKMFMMIQRTGVKVLLCHGATTSGTVRRAEAAGITVVGFLRRGYMNIYTHSERITG